jgi:CheY-like chemotaxis protein
VENTGNAAEALSWLAERDYDAIILDVRMPGLSGIDIFHRLKERRPELAGRHIFITGDVMGGEVRHFFEENHLYYLMKPFSRSEIISTLCEMLPAPAMA